MIITASALNYIHANECQTMKICCKECFGRLSAVVPFWRVTYNILKAFLLWHNHHKQMINGLFSSVFVEDGKFACNDSTSLYNRVKFLLVNWLQSNHNFFEILWDWRRDSLQRLLLHTDLLTQLNRWFPVSPSTLKKTSANIQSGSGQRFQLCRSRRCLCVPKEKPLSGQFLASSCRFEIKRIF